MNFPGITESQCPPDFSSTDSAALPADQPSTPATQMSQYPKSVRAPARRGPHRMVPDHGAPAAFSPDGGYTAPAYVD